MIALYIGRFQPFHKGHLWAVRQILKDCDKIVIGIGSSQYKNTPTNPYSAHERKEMIRESLKDEGINNFCIFEIPDIHNDNEWVEHVKKIIPKFNVIYTGSPLTRRLFSRAGYEVRELKRHANYSASLIRLKMANGKRWDNMVPPAVARCINGH